MQALTVSCKLGAARNHCHYCFLCLVEPTPANGEEAGIYVSQAAGSLGRQEGTTQIGQHAHAAVDGGVLVDDAIDANNTGA